ncbi:hypothetical protein [Rahnella sp. AA]|uniref:hypothetical protein n=1 Tax=Rahnella sp. AA TaxID=2057180 RepID=UPI0012FE9C5E|nr:hypothetical protein [Rahnella sp. AA]
MHKVSPLKIHDLVVLRMMNRDPGFSAHAHVASNFKIMRKRYIQYKKSKGSPFVLSPITFPKNFKDSLKYHFSHPRSELEYISKIRYKLSPNCCPLCGGFGSHTVDHYLPKASFPELTLYSLNLIPACACNSLRSNVTHGTPPHESTIHPYFDNGLDERLMKIIIQGVLLSDDVEIDFCALPCSIMHVDKINFHIENVVRKSTAKYWMQGKWASLIRNPLSVITAIPDTSLHLSFPELVEYLNKMVADNDRSHGTPNNWYSMFFYGIGTDVALINWLVGHCNGIFDGTIDPMSF